MRNPTQVLIMIMPKNQSPFLNSRQTQRVMDGAKNRIGPISKIPTINCGMEKMLSAPKWEENIDGGHWSEKTLSAAGWMITEGDDSAALIITPLKTLNKEPPCNTANGIEIAAAIVKNQNPCSEIFEFLILM